MTQPPIVDTPQNWDAASAGYAEKVAPLMMESFADEFVMRLEVDSTMDVLEVASGSGALSITLSKKVKSLLATDFSPKMQELLASRVREAGLTNVSFAIMDGQALDLKDNCVDRAACSFGLMLFPDRYAGFSELNRVVRPGGKVLVSGWAGPEKFEALGLFLKALQQAFPEAPKPTAPPPVFSLANLDSFKSEMETAGFQNVTTDYITRSVTIDSFEKLWAMLTIGAPPVKKLIEKFGDSGLDKIRIALSEIVDTKFGSGPITLVNTATVGVAIAG
ncbi:MAG: hypothetical protein DHS20C17_24740 [Cyclobacteriaceae bacterium]|nr:MAG: hypothetical protein DHS20C17_24740 [Cyclobacteriaceae bacterium]